MALHRRSYDRTKRVRELGIAVMDEIPATPKETPFVHGDIPSDLLHPGFIGVYRKGIVEQTIDGDKLKSQRGWGF